VTRLPAGVVALAPLVGVLALAGCPPPKGPVSVDEQERRERWYRLAWHGAPVGWAVERESDDTITRVEHVVVRRGGATVTTDLTIDVGVAADLSPRSLRVSKRENGVETRATATLAADGWHRDGAATAFAPPDAVPSELVPALVRVRGTFAGPVILSGWDLAVGDGVVIGAGDRRLATRIVVGDQAIDAAVEVDLRGNTVHVADSTDTESTRVADEATATAPFTPTDVVAAAAIPLPDAMRPVKVTLTARGTTRPPPLVPGQRVDVDGRRWSATLDPALPGDLPKEAATPSTQAEIDELARSVHETMEPSLAGNTASAGDCTAYAVAFAAYAGMAGIPVQVVTGYVVEGNALVRHRWNVAWNGSRWITVDASQPGASAPRLGVALSDASVVGLLAAASIVLEP
jgi:hypothetical protein